jgi:4-hydroxy-tetrahydrodipicolinate synthase
MKEFEGTFVVMVTPFTSNEELDLEAYRTNIDYFIENGIHGVIVGGSTGEFATLSLQEHKKIIETVVDHVNGRVPCIAGTAACSTRRVIELNQYSKDVGVDGVMIIPPFYSKPREIEIYEHFKNIAEAVDIPIMLYNNPWTSKVDMQPSLVAKLAEIDNITHIKESSGDITRIMRILQLAKDKITVFCGSDNLALESFLMGAKGWVCVAANIFPKHTSRLYELIKEGKFTKAKKLYEGLYPLCSWLEENGLFAQGAKAGLEIIGMKAGPTRKPLLPCTDKEKQELKEIIEKIQFIKL